jgi:hypothetical protein
MMPFPGSVAPAPIITVPKTITAINVAVIHFLLIMITLSFNRICPKV